MPIYPNDMLTSTFLTGAIQSRPTREAIKQGYIGESLLPMLEVPERKLSWDVMYNENNLAGVYDLKGQAIPGDDVLFSSVFANLIDIKASRHLDPDMANMIREPGAPALYRAGGQSPSMQSRQARERRHIQERIAWCDDAVDTMVEYIRMHAMQGVIQWPPRDENGNVITTPMPHWNAEMPLSFVFPLRNTFKQQASSLVGYQGRVNGAGQLPWTNASADWIQDLEIISELVLKTSGIKLRGGRIIMSDVTLGKLAFQANTLRAIVGANREAPDSRKYANPMEVVDYIKTKLGWNIETYDAQWTYRIHVPGTKPEIRRVNFLREGRIIIVPPGGPVGKTGTTFLRRADGTWQSGKYAWSYETPKPPHEIELGVNLVAWPLFEYYDWFVYDTDL